MSGVELRTAGSAEEVQAALALRKRVFVGEQKLFDATDEDAHDGGGAIYINAWRGGQLLVGTVRCYPDPAERGLWWGGRLAVEEAYRLRGVGVFLIEAAVEEMERRGAARFLAWVQGQNVELFGKLNWTLLGETRIIRAREHHLMEARLYVHDAQLRRRRRLAGC